MITIGLSGLGLQKENIGDTKKYYILNFASWISSKRCFRKSIEAWSAKYDSSGNVFICLKSFLE